VVKVRLSDFTRVGSLTLNTGEYGLRSAVIDTANGFAYFGTGTSPGKVVRVDLSAGAVATATVTGGGAVCQGDSTIVRGYLTGIAPWSITWSDGVTSTGILTSPAERSVSPTATTNYSVTAVSDNNGPGTSSGSALVTIVPRPDVPVVTAPSVVGAGSPNRTASVAAHIGSTYKWSITNGIITSGWGTNQITFTAGTSSSSLGLDVQETNPSGCASAQRATLAVAPAGSAVLYYTATPCRQLDTRSSAPIAPGGTLTVPLTGAPCGIPSGATSVSTNVTVTEPTAAGYLTAYPADQAKPLVSNANFAVGQTRANNAILRLATDGSAAVKVFNGSLGTTHVIIDVNGYFQ
jgi:hypothetical protein